MKLTDNELGELGAMAVLGQIGYEVGTLGWDVMKRMENFGLVEFIDRQDVGYETRDIFGITEKGHRLLESAAS